MNIYVIDGAATAFIAGLLTSPHCVGMCGPIGCAVLPLGKRQGSPSWAMAGYHAMRALAYALIGALAGWIGSAALDTFSAQAFRIFPWVMVALLVMLAFRLDRFLPKPKAWHLLFSKVTAKLRQLPQPLVGTGLGLVTPLIPCGPLYLIFTLCLFSGSPLVGAELGFGFALGTIPLLWAGQSGFFWL
ncbi:MAG: sulfite exporter TauE/SafE family protein, partial [Verrucomicrobiota bacterium]